MKRKKELEVKSLIRRVYLLITSFLYLFLIGGLFFVFSFITTAYHQLAWMTPSITLKLSMIVGVAIVIFSGEYYMLFINSRGEKR